MWWVDRGGGGGGGRRLTGRPATEASSLTASLRSLSICSWYVRCCSSSSSAISQRGWSRKSPTAKKRIKNHSHNTINMGLRALPPPKVRGPPGHNSMVRDGAGLVNKCAAHNNHPKVWIWQQLLGRSGALVPLRRAGYAPSTPKVVTRFPTSGVPARQLSFPRQVRVMGLVSRRVPITAKIAQGATSLLASTSATATGHGQPRRPPHARSLARSLTNVAR